MDNMYTVLNLKDIKSTNPKEDKCYKAKFKSDYLDAIVITIGTREHCNKELKLRTKKFLPKKEKLTKLTKFSSSGKQSVVDHNENDQDSLLKIENNVLNSKIKDLESKITDLESKIIESDQNLRREMTVSEDRLIRFNELKKQIEIFKQNISIYLKL